MSETKRNKGKIGSRKQSPKGFVLARVDVIFIPKKGSPVPAHITTLYEANPEPPKPKPRKRRSKEVRR